MQLIVGAQELKNFAFTILAEYQRQDEQRRAETNVPETYLTTNQVCKMLGVNRSTLWRWEKSGYLVPQYAGNRCRYAKSVVTKILEEKQ